MLGPCPRMEDSMSLTEDLNRKFGSTLGCRVEQVALFERDFHHAVDTESTFKEEELSDLLCSRAMITRFLDFRSQPGLLLVVPQVVIYLTVQLKGLLE